MKIKNYFLLILLFASATFFSKAGTTTTYTINVNGTTRTFIVYVPTIYNGSKPVPLMLNIHGYTMSDASQQNMMNFDPVADTANFIVARPRGLNNAWSQATTVSSGQADRNFIWNMIDSLKSWYNINPCKIYSAGFSQGSFMSQILVLNVDNPSRAPVIAAIGSSSGGISKSGNPSYWAAKNPTHPVPVLHLHGTSDGTISYDGGGTQNPASVNELMDFWVTHNNCNPTSTMTTCGSIDHYVWDGGDRGTRVELYKVNGGSHSAPNNTCMNSAKTIWEFCRPYCLPYLTSTTCTDVPTISAQPASQTITTGNTTTFAVTANGCVGTALTYQWQVNTGSGFANISNSSPYSGVTTGTLTVTSATTGLNTYQYRCFVGSCCYDVYSSSATLTVTSGCTAPTITGTTPASRCDAGTVTLAATASAGTINWYAASTGGSSLGTGPSFTSPNISTTTTYYVDATDNNCTSSRTAIIATVNTSPTAIISGDATICSGASSIISIAFTGTAPWSFTYGSATGSTPVSNITSSTYTTTASAGTYTLSALSDASSCTGTFSGSATITENTAITVSTETVTCDGSNANYTVEFDISGGDAGSYTVDGSAANIVSSHYTSAAITSGSSYSLTVTDSYNCSPVIVSGSKTCASNCNATAVISGDATICSGTSTVVSIDLTGTAPWSVTYAIDANNQTPVATSSSTYTFTTSAAGVYSLASVTDGNSCTATTSGSATITERTPLSVSTATVTCDGSNANYTVEFDISGGDASSYTVDGSAANITSSHFTSSAIASGSSYSFTVNDANNCSPVVVSGTKTCGIACNATADISGDATICSGTSATISIALTGTAPWSVTYAIGGLSQTPITTTSSTYTFTTSTAGIYTLASVSDGNSCAAITSGSATVNVNTAISISNKTETCNGGNADYVVEFDISGGDPASYAVTGGTGTLTSPTHFTSNSITSGTAYSLSVTDSYNCSPVSVSGTKTCSSPPVCNATASISGDATICAGATTTISITLTGTAPWNITYAKDGTNQTPATATSSPYTFTTGSASVYTLVSVTDGNSCTATTSGSATIIVNALPSVSTIANPSSAAVCIGSPVTLSGAGALTYSWSGGISDGVAFFPSVGSTTYTLSGTDANNCSNTATRVVTAYPLPAVGISASPASVSVCAGSTVILIGTGAASYFWSTGSTTSAITLVPAITETITVTGTDANSCTNTATKIVIAENCNPGTGIEENTSLPSFSVYPNPTGGMLNISISNASGAEVITSVINVFGTEVFSTIEKNIPADHTKQINLGDLTKGMYYIKLNINGDIQIKKLVIQ